MTIARPSLADAYAARSAHARRIAPALIAVVLLADSTACRDDRARPRRPASSAPPAARRVTLLDSARWILSGAESDSVLDGALALAADDSTAYVLAADGRRLAALDARDGRTRWTLPRTTAAGDTTTAPVFARVTAVARTPLGNVVLLDGTARRIHVIGAEGRLRETIPLPPEDEPTRLCARADGGWLVAGGDPQGRLAALQPGGTLDWTLALPWARSDSLQRLQLQALLASSPDGRTCIAALRLGAGFATVAPGSPPTLAAHAYVEQVAIPAVRTVERRKGADRYTITTLDDAPAAAADVAVAESTIAIAFEGATRERHRTIDLHALGDGAYRGSLLHETPIVAIAAWRTRLYVLHRLRGRFALAAYDVRALADGVPADAPTRSLAPASPATAAAP